MTRNLAYTWCGRDSIHLVFCDGASLRYSFGLRLIARPKGLQSLEPSEIPEIDTSGRDSKWWAVDVAEVTAIGKCRVSASTESPINRMIPAGVGVALYASGMVWLGNHMEVLNGIVSEHNILPGIIYFVVCLAIGAGVARLMAFIFKRHAIRLVCVEGEVAIDVQDLSAADRKTLAQWLGDVITSST